MAAARSDTRIQPCRKHPKTFILYLSSKLSLTRTAICSLHPALQGPCSWLPLAVPHHWSFCELT